MPGPPAAAPRTPVVPVTVVRALSRDRDRPVPSIERALARPGRITTEGLGWRRKVKVVAGTSQGPGKRDQEALDSDRARLPLTGPKRILVLGCTSGAGQTVTALMTGYILASLREQPVAAVDLHDGGLGHHVNPAGQVKDLLSGAAPDARPTTAPDGLKPHARKSQGPLDVIVSDGEPLGEADVATLARILAEHYPLVMLDPGPNGLPRLLHIVDQLVLVAPADAEAAQSLAGTRDWLDAHGFGDLVARSVTLINGVSRRSIADVEQTESVARGRCRAIVRVPWDDQLPVGAAGPSVLLPQTRVAYTALAGVVIAGLAAAPVRAK
jgi:MinD-like ATPase involved in chromosome partitioning or flagellar assembly